MSGQSTDGTERLRPQCFNPNCDKSFDSVNEMVAIQGRGERCPRHFCEECAERVRRGPPMTDGGTVEGDTDHLTDESPCPECGNRTLTERGVRVTYNDGTERRTGWLGCINCEWDNRSIEADTDR